MGVALITHITYVRNIREKNIYNKVILISTILLLYHRGCSKNKKKKYSGSSYYYSLEAILVMVFKIFPGYAPLRVMDPDQPARTAKVLIRLR